MPQKNKTTTNFKFISIKKFYIISVIAYIAVIIWLVVVTTFEGQTQITVCPSKMLYHIPCPGCGITRATILFLGGDFYKAFFLNPNVVFSLSFIFVYPILVILSLLTRKHLIIYTFRLLDSFLKRKMALLVVLFLELAIWICNIYRGI